MSTLIGYLPKMFKALTGAVTAGAAAYAGAVDGGVTADEWIVLLAAAVAAGVAVWFAPNRPAEA